MVKIVILLILFIFIGNNLYAETEFYLTLRSSKVNLRQGPSLNHPIKLVYKKKFLPVLVIDKSYNFRKIKDHENNSGWIHISQLSKKRAALNNKDKLIIFNKSSKYSKPLAVVQKGRLFLIKKCKGDWCKVKTEKFSGWVGKENLVGRL
ncbi:MAG: hypothetical protein CBD56_00135 [Candidatus Pelagibacter sp. TMED196]|nr:MAG: hypothetical protein CBD56_00135 [Candidatus Pelagibacter sp. TMED196]|tara:strand:- start:1296 stop:1742 length:447 start_codon:yes stop_codon:yes gene_type:complete